MIFRSRITWWVMSLCFSGLQAQKHFDPATDTIALCNQRGMWKMMVPESTLIASVQLVAPKLVAIQSVRVQDIHGKPYLFFRGKQKEAPAFGYTIMVQLEELSTGVWKAGNIYQACWGNTCSECGFDDYWGCSCERYDGLPDETAVSYCNHMVALGMGLMKITIPD